MPTNAEIRDAGFHFSKRFFTENGYKIIEGKFIGYDYELNKNDKTYFALVKSSNNDKFTQRWLEKTQDDICHNEIKKFLLILIKNSPKDPSIYGIFTGECLIKRKEKLKYHQYYNLKNPPKFEL